MTDIWKDPQQAFIARAAEIVRQEVMRELARRVMAMKQSWGQMINISPDEREAILAAYPEEGVSPDCEATEQEKPVECKHLEAREGGYEEFICPDCGTQVEANDVLDDLRAALKEAEEGRQSDAVKFALAMLRFQTATCDAQQERDKALAALAEKDREIERLRKAQILIERSLAMTENLSRPVSSRDIEEKP